MGFLFVCAVSSLFLLTAESAGAPRRNNKLCINSTSDAEWNMWKTFICDLHQKFQYLRPNRCSYEGPPKTQFAVLYLGREPRCNQQGNLKPYFKPFCYINRTDKASKDSMFPLSPLQYGNYLGSRVDYTVKPQAHAEARIFQNVMALVDAYKREIGRTIRFAIIYSYLMFCDDCTNKVINNFSPGGPLANIPIKIAAYSSEFERVQDKNQAKRNRQKLAQNGIKVIQVPVNNTKNKHNGRWRRSTCQLLKRCDAGSTNGASTWSIPILNLLNINLSGILVLFMMK